MPIRSPALTCSETGPRREVALAHGGLVERRDDRARARRGADRELQRPLLARLLDLLEAGDPALHLAHLLGLLLAWTPPAPCGGSCRCRAPSSSRCARPASSTRAGCGRGRRGRPSCRRTPRSPRARAGGRSRAPRGTRRSRRRRPRPGAWARSSSTIRVTHAGEELAVVADQHDAAAQAAHERLQPLQAVEVEVVGGLVEQHDVEAAEQQGGQRRPGPPARRTARSSARRRPTSRPRSASTAGGGRRGRRRRWPASGRGACGVGVLGGAGVVARAERRGGRAPSPRSRRRPRCGGRRSRRRSRPATRSCSCGSQPTKASRGRGRDVPASGSRSPARMPQQRGLAGAVGADDARPRRPGATVRSRDSKRVRWAWPPARFLATRSALIRAIVGSPGGPGWSGVWGRGVRHVDGGDADPGPRDDGQ